MAASPKASSKAPCRVGDAVVDREMPDGHLQRVYVRIRKGGDVAQLVRASDRHADDVGLIPRCGEGFFFLPRVNFQCRLSYVCPYTPVCNRTN